MKSAAGSASPRRRLSPKNPALQKPVQLELRRPAPSEYEPEPDLQRKNTFWKWFGFVALLHVALIVVVGVVYTIAPKVQPPEQFISLLPPGDVVKGTPGTQSAPKLGPTTPAPSVHHSQPTPVEQPQPPTPVAIKPPPPQPSQPDIAKLAPPPDKPIPAKSTPPKVKVDLNLVDAPAPATKPAKPKPHLKKPVTKATPNDSNSPDRNTPSTPDGAGISKEQIAAKLGDKLKAAGITDSVKIGSSGSDHSQANSFADFYQSIHDQVMNKWTSPNLTDETAVNPIVLIHVEKDGRVPPENVTLTQSSGNLTYDDSALAAAKSLGYLLQPLPDGCPPDIHITFKLTR